MLCYYITAIFCYYSFIIIRDVVNHNMANVAKSPGNPWEFHVAWSLQSGHPLVSQLCDCSDGPGLYFDSACRSVRYMCSFNFISILLLLF